MHFIAALTALVGLAAAAPTPQDDGAAGPPDFQILTCQAQSIKVKTQWNTAFVTTDSAFTHYGEAEQVVPLNGCADLYPTFKAYSGNAAENATAYSSLPCTIHGAPWGADAELHIVDYVPYFELVNGDGVAVVCGHQDGSAQPQPEGEDGGEGDGTGEDGQEGTGEGEDEGEQTDEAQPEGQEGEGEQPAQ